MSPHFVIWAAALELQTLKTCQNAGLCPRSGRQVYKDSLNSENQ